MNRVAAFVVLSFLSLFARSAGAAPIVGSDVTGSLRFGSDAPNWFDPANKKTLSSALNKAGATVTISATATEFGFKDSLNTYTADFTGTQLIITDIILGTSNKIEMNFTDAAFLGATVTEVSDNFPIGGIGATLTGSTITVTGPGSGGAKFTTFTAIFNVTPASVSETATTTPEPSTLLLFVVSGGAAILAHRRVRRAAPR